MADTDTVRVRTIPIAAWYWHATGLVLLLAADGWPKRVCAAVIWAGPVLIQRIDRTDA